MSDTNPLFKFNKQKNVAVFTLQQILESNKPILLVSHDIEDGSWQFLTGEPVNTGDVILVALEEIIKYDQTLNDLLDLPVGWQATRTHIGGQWKRKQK